MGSYCRVAGVWCLLSAVAIAVAASGQTLTGTLVVNWADPGPETNGTPLPAFFLADDDGTVHALFVEPELLEAAGGLYRINRQRVRVQYVQAEGSPIADVQLLELVGAESVETALSGPLPWVSIMCRFPDVPETAKDLAFFQGMFDNTSGRLDHYWREVSYGAIDVAGSKAVGWVDLPEAKSHYIPKSGAACIDGDDTNDADLAALFLDCTAAADDLVDFVNGEQPLAGINLMFNADLGGCSWGGGWPAELDGVTQVWRTTWMSPWGWTNVGVTAHEMGHTFGLPHSNNWDGDDSPFDSGWDGMSDAWGWAGWDATYGRLGKHMIAFHKADILGWIPDEQVYIPEEDSRTPVVIDDLALASTKNFRLAWIAVPDTTHYYTVEVRGWTGHYDAHLPGQAVVIHEVVPNRMQPAWAVDADRVPAADASGEGTMWRVGETFRDRRAEISVFVKRKTEKGFEVVISVGSWDTIFVDGFESGDSREWSSTFGDIDPEVEGR